MPDEQTSLSLLDQLSAKGDQQSWQRLADLYTPVLRNWLRRYELQESDADDLVQDVLVVVAREIQSFEHTGRAGAFRSWLKTILIHRLRNWWRGRKYRPTPSGDSDFLKQLDQFEDPNSALSQIWNEEHDRQLTRQLLAQVEPRFSDTTREAFRRVVLLAQDVDQVAADLKISRNAVIIAKHRVIKALRQAGDGLLGR